jgi:AbrB family looped-hinge helix DNA binding protein
MAYLRSSVSPKGQVTIPVELRRLLGLKPKDQVAFSVNDGKVQISRALTLDDLYMSVPALKTPMTDEAMVRSAMDQHIDHVAQEGLDP